MGEPLKFLFSALYNDGTLFEQTPEDVSEQDPKRNCLYDVDHSRLIFFEMTDGRNTYGVDLRDGTFFVNGEAFRAHPEQGLSGYTLVYVKRHTHCFSPDLTEIAHKIEYRVGWKALDESGAEIERVMGVR